MSDNNGNGIDKIIFRIRIKSALKKVHSFFMYTADVYVSTTKKESLIKFSNIEPKYKML